MRRLVAGSPHAAGEDVLHAELAPNRLRISLFVLLSCIADVREITLSDRTFDKSEMISSVSPSLK